MDNIPQERQRRILLLQTDKELGETLVGWLKEDGLAVMTVETAQQAFVALMNDVFNLLLLDMDRAASLGEDTVSFIKMLRHDRRTSPLTIVVLAQRQDTSRMAQAVEAGADGFILKPLERKSFLKGIDRIWEEAEFRKAGKKLIDLNQIHFFLKLTEEADREGFFVFASMIFNKLVMERIKSVLGEAVILTVMGRLQDSLEEERYAFMKYVRLSDMKFSMDEVERRYPHIPPKELAEGFRHFTYAFLKMIGLLTSNILIGRPMEILLAEDNPGDVRLTDEALKESGISYRLAVAQDGIEAMDILREQGGRAHVSLPDLILLDLNLPRKDGRQVLTEIKNDSLLQDIPVVIMTVSKEDEEIFKSQGLKFDSYIVKPFDVAQFYRVIRLIESENFDALKKFLE